MFGWLEAMLALSSLQIQKTGAKNLLVSTRDKAISNLERV